MRDRQGETFRVWGERPLPGVVHAQGYPLTWRPGGSDFVLETGAFSQRALEQARRN